MTDVVLVSGGAAVTPFTTPDVAADSGLAAGNSVTALRAHLLAQGVRVFTAPARIGAGTVTEDPGWQGFAGVPLVLPAELTINAVGTIDRAGEALAAFMDHLAERYDVSEAVLVGHSMGGLFSRAAIARLASSPSVSIRGLVTLGTPWTGSLLGDYLTGAITGADAHGDAFTSSVLTGSEKYASDNSQGAADEVSVTYLGGPEGWNSRHAGQLDSIPVTVIAGDHFAAHDQPTALWPHDGLVALRSASATDVPAAVLPTPQRLVLPDVHSIFFADAAGLPWERALTWDPDALAAVAAAVAASANREEGPR
ncbi:lipase family alpha/beta hydrolase [Microbacterium sp. P07]|uniref:lipase family alpha/beta hydrolase n=1 Tax=Microbacterium sp. P07 TaxID=3366952 RepID=UPI003745AA6D